MYKQNQGLMARGTVGAQSTGGTTIPTRKLQSINLGGTGAAMGRPSVGSQIWGALNPMNWNIGPSAGTQPTPAPQPQQKAPPMPSAPMMAPRQIQRPAPRVGAIYSLPTNVTDVGPVSQEPTVTAGYRPPVESAAARVQNPFTPEMQALMEAKAIEQAEQQAAVTAQRLNAQLAGTGLMSGGPSGLSAGVARQVAMGTEANRLNALREIGLQVPQMRAEFDLRQAGMIDPYSINASGEARALSRQPGELSLQEQQIRSAVIENDLKAIGLEQESDERVRKARIDDILNKAGLTDLERQAAERAFEESDPENPWNWRIWGALAGGIDALEKLSRIPKNLSGLGSGGK